MPAIFLARSRRRNAGLPAFKAEHRALIAPDLPLALNLNTCDRARA